MTSAIALAILALVLLALAFWAGHRRAKARYTPPLTSQGHVDEYLVQKGGQWVPYDPPKYVPEGMNPVVATWEITRKTGIPHHTRRVDAQT